MNGSFWSDTTAIVAWALQLTKGRQQLAEDLIQDAFVFLVHSRPDFGTARNTDAYLYGILRNLHRAQLSRAIRQQQMSLPILDFDSAEWALSVLNDEILLRAQNDLRRICHFSCHRKETAKSPSILILRFFHGFYPTEIAAIARCSRAAVDERLRQARREAKLYLEDPSKFHILGRPFRLPAVCTITQSAPNLSLPN